MQNKDPKNNQPQQPKEAEIIERKEQNQPLELPIQKEDLQAQNSAFKKGGEKIVKGALNSLEKMETINKKNASQ